MAVDGWAVTFATASRGLGGAAAHPGPSSLYQIKCSSPPIIHTYIQMLRLKWHCHRTVAVAAASVHITALLYTMYNTAPHQRSFFLIATILGIAVVSQFLVHRRWEDEVFAAVAWWLSRSSLQPASCMMQLHVGLAYVIHWRRARTVDWSVSGKTASRPCIRLVGVVGGCFMDRPSH